jgi:hypothetical protein
MSQKIPADLQVWIEARKRFNLSHAQVQMARELGMNPKKLGGLANHKQEPWKAPLPRFIEELYFRRFSRVVPERVVSLEARARELSEKKRQRRELRATERESKGEPGS